MRLLLCFHGNTERSKGGSVVISHSLLSHGGRHGPAPIFSFLSRLQPYLDNTHVHHFQQRYTTGRRVIVCGASREMTKPPAGRPSSWALAAGVAGAGAGCTLGWVAAALSAMYASLSSIFRSALAMLYRYLASIAAGLAPVVKPVETKHRNTYFRRSLQPNQRSAVTPHLRVSGHTVLSFVQYYALFSPLCNASYAVFSPLSNAMHYSLLCTMRYALFSPLHNAVRYSLLCTMLYVLSSRRLREAEVECVFFVCACQSLPMRFGWRGFVLHLTRLGQLSFSL